MTQDPERKGDGWDGVRRFFHQMDSLSRHGEPEQLPTPQTTVKVKFPGGVRDVPAHMEQVPVTYFHDDTESHIWILTPDPIEGWCYLQVIGVPEWHAVKDYR